MLISLGYSCQTRFMIDSVVPDLKRQPFDFNITSRAALIMALETDGASLQHSGHTATTFVIAKEQREGVEAGGMYFWHDYPLNEDRLTLHRDWADKSDQVNAKYAMLWQRFSQLLRSDTDKTLVLSNSQHNLPQFTPDMTAFDARFGLGRRAFEELTSALDAYGARNYRLQFLSRGLHEIEETADLHDDRLDHRFVGTLSLRIAPELAADLLAPTVPLVVEGGAAGNGRLRVEAISSRNALIFDREQENAAIGCVSQAGSERIAVFQGRDQVFSIDAAGNLVSRRDGSHWQGADGESLRSSAVPPSGTG